MTLNVVTDEPLSQVVPPNLPLGPMEYSAQYQDQFNNVLRLYFNQLNKIVGQLKTTGTSVVADLPSASAAGAGSRLFVTNALSPTFGATVVGGGTVAVPVYSDGTNWKVG